MARRNQPHPSPLRPRLGVLAVNHPSLEVFLSACGSSEPLRLGVGQRNGPLSQTWTFPQPFVVIGRRPESDLVLDHWQVSRRHTYLQLIEGRYYCVDLGSRTGTHGGDATERSGWLEPGRAIRIGPFAVRPEWPDPGDRDKASLPGVTWELPGRAIGQAAWRMDRHLALIGRSPACKIRIVEPDVSKFHCSLVLTINGVWVVDLLGQNGVFVNDRPVRCARIEDGDDLRVGRHTLRARYDTPPAPLPRPRARPVPSSAGAPWPRSMPPALFPASGPAGNLPSRLMPPDAADPPAAGPGPLGVAGEVRRGRRPFDQPPGSPVRHDAAADVRPVSSDDDDDVRRLRRAPPRAVELAPRGVRPGPQAQRGDRGVAGRDGPSGRGGGPTSRPAQARGQRPFEGGRPRPPSARPIARATRSRRPHPPRPSPGPTSTPSSASGCRRSRKSGRTAGRRSSG